MSISFEFHEPEFLTVGTLGPKGQREFFLQARGDGQLVSLKLEKQQVAALADYLDQVLTDLPSRDLELDATDLGLREPVIAAWAVGSLGIAYAEDTDRLILLAEAMPGPDDDEDDEIESPPSARFALRRGQVVALIERARSLVSAGRPPCVFCGRPLEPRNRDWCPCQN